MHNIHAINKGKHFPKPIFFKYQLHMDYLETFYGSPRENMRRTSATNINTAGFDDCT